jgi:hypothetical protein
MAALTILIIRHAEKPDEAWPGPGLTPEGAADKKSLVVRGWQRAGSWSALFGTKLGGDSYPKPAVIYAADPNGTTGDDPSKRPFETITPLAARRKLTPVTKYAVEQETPLAAELVGLSGVVLVCWEHNAIIAHLLPALAGTQKIAGLPTHWDGTRFDVVLRFDRAKPGAAWTFSQLFPRLMSGDSKTPLV